MGTLENLFCLKTIFHLTSAYVTQRWPNNETHPNLKQGENGKVLNCISGGVHGRLVGVWGGMFGIGFEIDIDIVKHLQNVHVFIFLFKFPDMSLF